MHNDSGPELSLVEKDLLEAQVEDLGLYDAVLIDAPCSNTGVIRRRPDVKWRLQAQDISRCTHLQGQLIQKAAAFVRPGGRLVYATCSIEVEENLDVVTDFLKTNPAFTLEASTVSLPWECQHDGGGAFVLVHGASQAT